MTDLNSKYHKLEKFVNLGYLLHGSGKKFATLRPNKRKKISPRVGNLKAVYATDDPLMAMFLAVLDSSRLPLIGGSRKSLIGWYYNSEHNIQIAATPNYHKYEAFKAGFVYVLENVNFKLLKKLPHEFYSYNNIKPAKIVKVFPRDLFSKIKLEVYPIKAVRDANFHTEKEIELMGY